MIVRCRWGDAPNESEEGARIYGTTVLVADNGRCMTITGRCCRTVDGRIIRIAEPSGCFTLRFAAS